jgi:hypothetical protein
MVTAKPLQYIDDIVGDLLQPEFVMGTGPPNLCILRRSMRFTRACPVLLFYVLVIMGCPSSRSGGGGGGATDDPVEDVETDGGSDERRSDSAPDRCQNILEVGAMPTELDALSGWFSQYVSVFGVHVVATETAPAQKVLHAANVLAEYLDNDEDGAIDDPDVLEQLLSENALLVMFGTFREAELSDLFETDVLDGFGGQDLYADETAEPGSFDFALEEVLHLVQNVGFSLAHPDELATTRESDLTRAMDVARGGSFQRVPAEYPDEAWYRYDDRTCDYECQASEYFYWALTSLFGAQSDPERCEEIAEEWELCSPELVRERDIAVTELLRNPALRLPRQAPNGNYCE